MRWLLVLIVFARQAAAQNGETQLVAGIVVSKADRVPLPHAMVSLQPAGQETFTDDRGRFAFRRLSPGKYRIRAIHLGFTPVEVPLIVQGGGDPARVTIELDAVQVRLATIHVTADGPCLAPGAPDPAKEPAFAVIFQQLLQNAQQFRLLADSFPYAYRIQRMQYAMRGDSVIEGRRIDTLLLKSNDRRWKYRPGRVVTSSIFTREHAMHLPTLSDFASVDFVSNHCFRFAGEEQSADGLVARIDFRASNRLSSADVNGRIYLDAQSYQIRSAELRLSKIPDDLSRDFAAVSVTTQFREVEPSVLVFSRVHGVSSMAPTPNRTDYLDTLEDQTLIDFGFLQANPRHPERSP
jgi:hypothetical protein